MPVDVDGLASMGLSRVGTNDDGGGLGSEGYLQGDGDDDSDLEDIKIESGDAVVVVAKTEDVRTGT